MHNLKRQETWVFMDSPPVIEEDKMVHPNLILMKR